MEIEKKFQDQVAQKIMCLIYIQQSFIFQFIQPTKTPFKYQFQAFFSRPCFIGIL